MDAPVISVWILGDQLLQAHPALSHAENLTPRERVRVVLVETEGRLRRVPYHRHKLVLIISAMRHYAQSLRAAGYQVDYIHAPTTRAGLRQHIQQHQPERLITMAASEYRGRQWQTEKLSASLGLPVAVVPNTQFLSGHYNPYPSPQADKRYVMEYFYRAMRKHFNILMEGDTPLGGVWNYDKENRKPWPKKGLQPPPLPHFPPDTLTREVMQAIDALPNALGSTEHFALAVTHEEANHALEVFIHERLPLFGTYEDAMSRQHDTLYHSALSAYLNIGLLEPLPMIEAALAAYHAGDAPLNAVEGFVRQILGWREYIYWTYWRLMPDLTSQNAWGAERPLPAFFWDGETDMACLRHVLERVHRTGYAHHIERLMVLANFCTLAGIRPMEVNDWFSSFFFDAYEWVMLPNVLGMGLNADGGLTATKPYIASANYINKMSDYCTVCRYKPQKRLGEDACPFNTLYWNFLIEHEAALRANPRFGPSVLGLNKLSPAERDAIQAQAEDFLTHLPRPSERTN